MFSQLIEWLGQSQGYFRDLGWLGVLAYVGMVVAVQLTVAPLSPFSLASGFIFGLGRGYIAMTLGTALGAAINFLLARYLFRGVIARRIAGNERFRLIDAAIGREGWKIVALLRFCPIPYGVANYAYGLTAVRFWPYLIASIVAVIPGNLFFVWLGTTAQESLASITGAGRPRQPIEYVMLGIGIVAGLTALTYITRIARHAVSKAQPPAAAVEA